MTRALRRFWMVFAACATAVVFGMAWVTHHVLALEGAESRARCEAEHQGTLRLALWRMDSWLAAQLAPEGARPYFEYLAYYPSGKAYTRILGQIEPGEVLTPSPLLTFRSELFPIHFQVSTKGDVTSPQVPTGNLLDLAQGTFATTDFAVNSVRLQDAEARLKLRDLAARLTRAEASPWNCTVMPGSNGAVSVPPPEQDYQARANASNYAKNPVQQSQSWLALRGDEVAPGPLLPIWLDAPPGSQGVPPGDRAVDPVGDLVFVRAVRVPGDTLYQGFFVDWSKLRQELLAQIADLFDPSAVRLVRESDPDDERRRRMLTTVPVVVDVDGPAVATPSWTTTRSILAAAWVVLLLALVAVGFTLGSAISFGHKRARFASAVTHELRSPLTTFRMYSEMLADDMVTDPAQRADYLRTLERESDRLSNVVENVLAYARIEEGRHTGHRQRITVDALIERVVPTLERRAKDAGFDLNTTVDDAGRDLEVEVDPEAVAQILFGLVDNACKYAGGAAAGDRSIDVHAQALGDEVAIAMRDHGTGIPAAHHKSVFQPFERGARATGESVVPGVGLGLALARGLAREQGGELTLDPAVKDGARFVLRLPRPRA